MADFAELKTRVLNRLIDTPASVQAELNSIVNLGLRRLQTVHNFKVMETTTAPLVTVTGTHRLAAVPSNWKQARGQPYLLEFDGSKLPLIKAPDRNTVLTIFRQDSTDDEDEPRVVLETEPDDDGARFFDVFPLPDGLSDYPDGEYRVLIPYWRRFPPLVNDNDTNWFTENAEEYIVAWATSEGFALDWDEARASRWRGEATQVFLPEAIKRDKLERVGTLDVLRVSFDVLGPKIGH